MTDVMMTYEGCRPPKLHSFVGGATLLCYEFLNEIAEHPVDAWPEKNTSEQP